MVKQKEAGFERTREILYRTIKNPERISVSDRAFFVNSRAFRLAGVTLLEFIEQNLPAIDLQDERYSHLLHRRFWKNETIRQVANDLYLSTDQVNRLQRDALNALTRIILDKERAIQETERQRLIDRLPAPNYSKLFGIEKLQNKLAGLVASNSEPWLIAVSGIGGIGKTALVDSVIRNNFSKFHYKDIAWIRFTRAGDIPIWERLTLSLTRRLLPNQDATNSQTKALGKLLKKEPHLIIIDGLDSELDEQLLGQLQKMTNPTRILVTCRTLPTTSLDTHLLKVSEIDLESAQQLLEHQAMIIGLDETVQPYTKAIFQVAGGNPLALKVVVGLLKTWSLDTAIHAIRDGKSTRLKGLFDSIFLAALGSLTDVTRKVFEAMIFAGNDGTTLNQLQVLTQSSEIEVREAISDLVLRSLIEVSGSVNERRYGIHNLTETFLRSQLSDNSPRNNLMSLSNINYWLKELEDHNLSAVLESDGSNI